jgi:hypothetical protein
MRYLLLLLALVTVIVGAHKISSRIDANSPVRTAEFIPLPPHAR